MKEKGETVTLKQEKFSDPSYFMNRELSWVKFDERVLNEARDRKIPLFERLKFLSITASNLDEFFMVRVASLKDMVNAGYQKKDISGMTAQEQLDQLNVVTHELVKSQYNIYNRSLLPLLKENGLCVVEQHEDLDGKQQEYVDKYFEENVYPVLTPILARRSRIRRIPRRMFWVVTRVSLSNREICMEPPPISTMAVPFSIILLKTSPFDATDL